VLPVWQAGEVDFRPMRTMWINIAMSDSSSFHVTLAHASALFAPGPHEDLSETTESLKHYTASVQAVSRRLQDPVESISDSIIGTVLGFSCLDVRNTQTVHSFPD
jgi:hypothetical protein